MRGVHREGGRKKSKIQGKKGNKGKNRGKRENTHVCRMLRKKNSNPKVPMMGNGGEGTERAVKLLERGPRLANQGVPRKSFPLEGGKKNRRLKERKKCWELGRAGL